MGYLIVYPGSSGKLTAIKAVLKALKVDFEEGKTTYNADLLQNSRT
ncbi:DUF2683 family protein [Parapedobacter sp.]